MAFGRAHDFPSPRSSRRDTRLDRAGIHITDSRGESLRTAGRQSMTRPIERIPRPRRASGSIGRSCATPSRGKAEHAALNRRYVVNKDVARSTMRSDQGFVAERVELASQPTDLHVDSAVVRDRLQPIGLFNQLFPAEDGLWI